jgi:hypothetical protein
VDVRQATNALQAAVMSGKVSSPLLDNLELVLSTRSPEVSVKP